MNDDLAQTNSMTGSAFAIANKNIAKTWRHCLLSLGGMNADFPVPLINYLVFYVKNGKILAKCEL